jgi:hypothetical protein
VALSGLRMGSVGQVGDSGAFCPDALSLALFETWDWPLPRPADSLLASQPEILHRTMRRQGLREAEL